LIITFPRRQLFVVGKFAKGRVCKTSQSLKDSTPFSSISLSLSFQMFRSSIDGAVPIIPGCVKPGNRTPFQHKQIMLVAISEISMYHVLDKNDP